MIYGMRILLMAQAPKKFQLLLLDYLFETFNKTIL